MRKHPHETFAKYSRPTDSGCVEWIGATLKDGGYGVFRAQRRLYRAHRFAYESVHGPLQPGMSVCHTCDNPRCVNVDHLFAGTNQDNHDDMMRKKRNNFGVNYGNAKATHDDVRRVRGLHAAGLTRAQIKNRFPHLSVSAIWRIATGRSWSNVA